MLIKLGLRLLTKSYRNDDIFFIKLFLYFVVVSSNFYYV